MTPLPSPSLDEKRFEAIYEQYFGLLAQIAIYKFRIAETEAEALVHDVLMSYLRRSATVVDLRSWLIGAICYASRHYWRLNGRTVPADDEADARRVDPKSLRILDSLTDQLAAREALECISPRCREVLHMRYFEGCTIAEIAAKIGIMPKSTQKLLTKCLRRAEKLYGEKGRPK
jgi:RNA polymerase sigma factor (sigma-70 family)